MLLRCGIIALFTLQMAWAGSAGGRGGGTGVLCSENAVPVTLEEFQLESEGQVLKTPAHRGQILAWLKKSLGHPSLYRKIKAAWSEIGPYDSWPEISGNDVTQALADQSSPTLFDQFKRVLAKLPRDEAMNEDSGDSSSSDLVGDDYFRVPPGCRKVQLSLIAEGKAKRVVGFGLSETTKRFLELHEAIYQIGMSEYRHHVARRTRDVIVAVHRGDSSEIATAARVFMRTESPKKQWYGRLSGLYVLESWAIAVKKNELFRVSNSLIKNNNGGSTGLRCPLSLSFSPDNTDHSEIVALHFDFDRGRPIAESLGSEMMTLGPVYFRGNKVHPGIRGMKILTEPGSTWFEDHVPIFYHADDFFDPASPRLRLSAVPADQSGSQPSALRLVTDEKGTYLTDYLGCQYVPLPLQTELDPDEVMKIWNSFVLSRYGRSDR